MRVSAIIASVLSLGLGLLPLAPPEHVHEHEEHGHAELLVHRHASQHHLAEHHGDHQSAVEEDHEPILTLTDLYTAPAPLTLAAPERLVSSFIEPPQPERVEQSQNKFDVPIHGPPRAPSVLRGPPFSPAS